MEWLSQNIGTLIVGSSLAIIVALIIIKMIRDRKKHKSSCSCGCSCGCSCCHMPSDRSGQCKDKK